MVSTKKRTSWITWVNTCSLDAKYKISIFDFEKKKKQLECMFGLTRVFTCKILCFTFSKGWNNSDNLGSTRVLYEQNIKLCFNNKTRTCWNCFCEQNNNVLVWGFNNLINQRSDYTSYFPVVCVRKISDGVRTWSVQKVSRIWNSKFAILFEQTT